jgi:hypothetical protein
MSENEALTTTSCVAEGILIQSFDSLWEHGSQVVGCHRLEADLAAQVLSESILMIRASTGNYFRVAQMKIIVLTPC